LEEERSLDPEVVIRRGTKNGVKKRKTLGLHKAFSSDPSSGRMVRSLRGIEERVSSRK